MIFSYFSSSLTLHRDLKAQSCLIRADGIRTSRLNVCVIVEVYSGQLYEKGIRANAFKIINKHFFVFTQKENNNLAALLGDQKHDF